MLLCAAVAASTFLLAACDDGGAPLTASGVSIPIPIPGQDRTVAYLTLENRSAAPLTVTRVTSPQFANVEMHATIVDNGMAHMQALDSITIAEHSSLEFAAGDRHLMLISPRKPLRSGDSVTLEFHYGEAGLLIVAAPLEVRPGMADE